MSFSATASGLTPEIYERFRAALETGKWPDGKALTAEQKQTVMEAILTWEAANLPEDQRTGFIPRNECQSSAKPEVIPTVNRDDA
ncbi:YeaC family protein [Salinispirillum sp. LH 10-3-1]|uniref:YeaC family protein n=1 Tax=Salinispirillum sp. LH 10-3-1 TaxID=2952525 RepID=A0AB38YJQ3_9GAMM